MTTAPATAAAGDIRQTLLRNTFWYGLVTVAGLVAGLVMSVVLARGLGPARMGDYSFLLWATRTASAIASLGFTFATVRYTAGALGRDDRTLAGAFLDLFVRRQAVATAIVVTLMIPGVLLLAPASLYWAFLVAAIALFPVTFEGVYTHAVYGAQRYDLTTQVSTIKMTLHLAAATGAMLLGGDILGIVVPTVMASTFTCFLQRRHARQLYPVRDGVIPADGLRELRAYIVPLSVVAVLDTLVWDRSEVFFLRLYASPQDIAFYSLAFGLSTRAMVIAEIAAGTVLPALSALYGRGDRDEFARVYRTALRYVALVGTAVAALGVAVAPGLVTVLYGEAYLPVAHLLGPMMAIAVIGVMRTVACAALRATGDRRWVLNATWISAAINVVAAFFLIAPWGTTGAVIANASAQVVASLVAFVGIARRQHGGVPLTDLLRIAATGGLALVAASAVMQGDASFARVVAAVVVGALVFGGVGFVSGVIGIREWNLVRSAGRALRPSPSLLRREAPRPARAALRMLGRAASALAGVVLLALYVPVVRDIVRAWSTISYYSYGFLVPVFSAYLVWEARRTIAAARFRWSAEGVLAAIAGLGLLATGIAIGSVTLKGLSLPVVLGATGLLALGRERFRPVVFPIGFLALAVPLPDGSLGSISLLLQYVAAVTADHALAVLGVPSVREGLMIHLPRVTVEVTESCNGLRFLLAMVVVGTACAWSTQRTPGRRAAVVVFAIVIAIAGNLVRVTGTALLVSLYGPAAATGFAHVAYGKVVYVTMLIPFLLGVLLLRRGAPRRARHA